MYVREELVLFLSSLIELHRSQPAILTWCVSRAFLEHHVKVGRIGEPRSLPNRLNRNIGIPQHILGLTNANVLQILSKGYAGNLLEASAQMRWADVKGLG